MSTETIIMQAGAVIFAAASLYFLFSGLKKPGFGTEFFISFITTTSYALMSQQVATTVSLSGQTIYWSRWLFYMVACPMLMYDTAKALKIPDGEYPWMVVLTWLTMFNGFLASYLVGGQGWVFFLLSCAAFVGLLFMVVQGEDNPGFPQLKSFVLVGWSLFPVVFLLSPTGFGVLGTAVCEAGYLVLDLATKFVFGVFTSRLK